MKNKNFKIDIKDFFKNKPSSILRYRTKVFCELPDSAIQKDLILIDLRYKEKKVGECEKISSTCSL